MTSINTHDIFGQKNSSGELKLSFGKFSPPPNCFSCGNKLPDSDFENFHLIIQKKIHNGEPEEHATKITLDKDLSQPYPRLCCRIMFMGDNLDYRKYSALYVNNLDKTLHNNEEDFNILDEMGHLY